MRNLILFALLSSAPLLARGPQLRCRVVALAGAKVKAGPWHLGEAGCTAAQKEAEFSSKIFGDAVIYKVQIQSGGKEMFVRLDMDAGPPAKDLPHIVQ